MTKRSWDKNEKVDGLYDKLPALRTFASLDAQTTLWDVSIFCHENLTTSREQEMKRPLAVDEADDC